MNDDFDWSDRSLHKETRSDEWKKSQNVPTSNQEPGTFILNSTEKMEGIQGNNT